MDGMRPKEKSEIPLEYKKLMKQCWDANPSKRPDIKFLEKKIKELNKRYHMAEDHIDLNQKEIQNNDNLSSQIINSISTFYDTGSLPSLPKPKNATEGIL